VTDHPEWWQEFFSGLALDYVRHSRDDEDTFAESDFIQEALELPEGSRLLDVPCGGGRLTLEMASRGYRVIGVDNSPDLIADATSQIDIERSPVTFEQRDMRDLPWQEEFDGAFCFWSSFGYFDDAGNLDFLKAVHNALKPGASLVLDTPLIETRLPEMESQERIWFPVGDLLALEERGFDHVNSRVESEWTFIRGSEVEQKLLSLRLYTYRELCAMLDEAGFGNHQAYGSLDWEPFELGATWLYMVTTKV
jgi:cyclopropane fatty-acyl-phospholipid synthase-like methyltransferase